MYGPREREAGLRGKGSPGILEEVIARIRSPEGHWFRTARARLDNLTKPPGSLGRLEECAARVVAIRGEEMPDIGRKAVFVFAGDHGVAEEGVSGYPREVTVQMVSTFLSGRAAVNVLAKQVGADVVVVDVGVAEDLPPTEGLVREKVVYGTRNFLQEPAMTEEEARRSMEVGVRCTEEYVARGYRLLAVGEMGIGNSTAASAVAAALLGRRAEEVVGPGTGVRGDRLAKKVRVVEEGVRRHGLEGRGAMEVLAAVGGAEIGAIAGAVLGAAAHRVPVVLDGLISTAGALVAWRLCPTVRDYLFAGHVSPEPGHRVMLEAMGLSPLLDLGMRLGEGTGAVLGMGVVEAGVRVYQQMRTFEEAGVARGKG
ncbi:nicotinate-nucleotide--dimethylbenzimidazole phosphoribosyltransferase [Spirochaeta thermophila]|uniref:Nicotinate-nucleotide--dimethylbenzimidazole phosphoribosyltransferase n=1 Tax=Winmispira thermophila (strain ATCC 49972 / DSM 6192 / RI 19.B1) TaxID=665571 RepID=E0RRF8_WINT6|nr:nicotinate-nucleotide--dimethylbenzimidazole phosphoribosyltransferase [Spirochaeta thermophila]ADN01659.1 nicotinate-nucleotide--dimethylbenzimidazolephosphoribosyltransferase [Spirochaeta thermophila DSM 6192]